MTRLFNLKNLIAPNKISIRKQSVSANIFIYVLVFFIAVAVSQAFQLGTMRSEAKSLEHDIGGIRAEQAILHEQYSFYNNNLSYYFGK